MVCAGRSFVFINGIVSTIMRSRDSAMDSLTRPRKKPPSREPGRMPPPTQLATLPSTCFVKDSRQFADEAPPSCGRESTPEEYLTGASSEEEAASGM